MRHRYTALTGIFKWHLIFQYATIRLKGEFLHPYCEPLKVKYNQCFQSVVPHCHCGHIHIQFCYLPINFNRYQNLFQQTADNVSVTEKHDC